MRFIRQAPRTDHASGPRAGPPRATHSTDPRHHSVSALRKEPGMDGFHRVKKYLRKHHVPFEVQHHPTAPTAQDVAAFEHVPGRLVAKCVLVVADGSLAMLVLPAPHRIDEERASKAMGARMVR